MIFKEFGKTGFKVSAIGMGTYYDPAWIAGSFLGIHRNKKQHIDAIKAGLESGINFIDTAEIYNTEPIVSEAIKGMNREELFIATKVFTNHLRKEKVIKSCNRSLKRLGMK
ncbi:MAG: aldo/keto reductase, partial [Thermoplasmataceae archaeon]